LYAQAPVIAVSIRPEDPGAAAVSPALEEILRVTIALAAEDRGFRAVLVSEPRSVPALSEFFLEARYAISRDRVVLRLLLADRRSIVPESSAGLERTLDPQFDREVSLLVAEILRPAEREISERPRPSPETLGSTEEAPQAAAVPVQPGPSDAATGIGQADWGRIPGRERRPSRPDFGAGVYLPVGAARSYFGAAGWVGAGWGFPLGDTGPWSAGPAAALAAFSMAGPDEAESGNYFMMLGAELSFRVPGAGKVSPFASVSAGPALVVVRGADPERYAKLMPYAAARLGASLRVSPRWRLGVDTTLLVLMDYEAGFESLSPVWGIAPRIFVSLESR